MLKWKLITLIKIYSTAPSLSGREMEGEAGRLGLQKVQECDATKDQPELQKLVS